MTEVEIIRTDRPFSISDLSESAEKVVPGQAEKRFNTGMEWIKKMSITYLKSPEEIEADFFIDRKEANPGLDQTRNNRDGYLNINPERIDSGFMEENY